jgi:hypothetical protein
MVMIVHKAIGIAEPSKPVCDVTQKVDEIAAVFVALKDLLTSVAPGRDVIEGTGVFNTERPCHKRQYITDREETLQ